MTTNSQELQGAVDLAPYKEAIKIITTKKGSDGLIYNNYGALNQASWIGEHAKPLITEIETLRTALSSATKELGLVNASSKILDDLLAEQEKIIEALTKERDKANERLAKVEKTFFWNDKNVERFYLCRACEIGSIEGPTFLEAIDQLKP